jgi:hypothetical protein
MKKDRYTSVKMFKHHAQYLKAISEALGKSQTQLLGDFVFQLYSKVSPLVNEAKEKHKPITVFYDIQAGILEPFVIKSRAVNLRTDNKILDAEMYADAQSELDALENEKKARKNEK